MKGNEIRSRFLNYFKDNNELYILFSYSHTLEAFINGIDKLNVDSKVTKLLNNCEVHTYNSEILR